MYDWTVGAIISGLGRGAASRLAPGELYCARARARARVSVAPARARARWRRDWRLFFRRGSKQGVCPAPRVLRLYRGPSLPLYRRAATHTLTRVGGPTGPRRWPREPRHRRGARVGCRPSWARRCTTRRSSTTVLPRSPVRIRSHCRGTAHEPLQWQQLVRPLAALPPRYRVQDLRIP
jgi:hypothetical protein